jgi:hypothetical protein
LANSPSQDVIVQGLQRALAEPTGLPLFASKNTPGLFAKNAAGKAAAQQCREKGWLATARGDVETEGKAERFVLSELGMSHLLEQTDAKPVLEAVLQALQRCQSKIHDWIEQVQKSHQYFEALRTTTYRVLEQVQRPGAMAPTWERNQPARNLGELIIDRLRDWQNSGKLGDCPMTEIYYALQPYAKITPGQFHDALRELHEQGKVYLHPWTGPLYELPQPPLSLLVGHEVAYYVSLR